MALDILGPASALNSTTARPGETRSFGPADTWFKPCTTPSAQDGTQLQAVYFNSFLANARALIRGMLPTAAQDNSDNMLLKAIQSAQLRYCIDSGAADVLVATSSPQPAVAWTNLSFLIQIAHTNLTTTPTVNIDGLGPKTIKRSDGSAIVVGDLPIGGVAFMVYDGTFVRLINVFNIPTVPARKGFVSVTGGITVLVGAWSAVSPSSANSVNALGGTSTFSNGVFTCGTGEEGWWEFAYHSAFFPSGSIITPDGWAAQIAGPNSSAIQTNLQAPPNGGNGACCSIIDKLVAGNVVTFSSLRNNAGGGVGGGTMACVCAGTRLGP
jgi:hypothetical protein